jgi:hypothetical protein
MGNTYISFQTLEYYIDHSNITNPGQLVLRSEILPVSSTIFKRDFIYMRNINYITDMDYLFSSQNEQDYTQVTNIKETVDLRIEGNVPGSFALLSVMMDNYIVNYERRFTKFQEVLANLGGLFKGLVTIVYILNYLLFKELYYFEIIMGIFKNNEKNQDMEKIIKPFVNLPKTNNSESKLVFNQRINELSSYVNPIKLNKRPNDIKMTILDSIIGKILKKKKMKVYSLAKAYTQNNLCIKSILNKLNELNKLKCFVFNQEQLLVFNSIGNPSYYNIINEYKDLWEGIVLSEYVSKDKDIRDTFINKQYLSDIDQNFIKMLKIMN